MAKKITISIPDDLADRFEPFKDKVSPSSIFQKALEQILAREERINKHAEDDMEAIIERLRKEKAETSQDFYELGRKEGITWAKDAHYTELLKASTFQIPIIHGEIMDFSDSNEDEGTLEYAMYEFYEKNPEVHPDDKGFMTKEAAEYVKGFMESIINFWEKVRTQI